MADFKVTKWFGHEKWYTHGGNKIDCFKNTIHDILISISKGNCNVRYHIYKKANNRLGKIVGNKWNHHYAVSVEKSVIEDVYKLIFWDELAHKKFERTVVFPPEFNIDDIVTEIMDNIINREIKL